MVLVLGGAGYVGSHFSKALRQAGEQHVVFDDLSSGHREAVEGSNLIEGDVHDIDALTAAMAGADIVALFAGSISVGESVRNPGKYFRNNLSGALSVLGAMEAAGVRNIIFSSTAAVYGNPIEIPITEEHPKAPTSPYGESKLAVEKALEWYCKSLGFNAVCLRYFNAAGADPEGEIGEDHKPEEHLIPAAIEAALGQRESLTVFGSDYVTTDGTCVRDYVHVADLADAHLSASRLLRNDCGFLALNLGTGTGNSVMQVIETVSRVSGKEVPHTIGPRRAGDPPQLVASPARAIKTLNWQPRFSTLDSMVEHAWNWKQAHPNGYSF